MGCFHCYLGWHIWHLETSYCSCAKLGAAFVLFVLTFNFFFSLIQIKLTAKKELILHFVDGLMRAIELYKQRMEWLTSESRQIFGVIQERCIVIVLDFGSVAPAEFDLCRDALSVVLVEQVTQIAKFNLIR